MEMDLDGIVQIGEIVNTHGVKGELKVIPLTDDINLFYQLSTVTIIGANARFDKEIVAARPFKRMLLIQLSDIDNLDEAKNLKGFGIFTAESELRPLASDECFVHDLIDASVYTTEDEYLGVITGYFESGPQGICEVTTDHDKFLFPTSKEILKEVIPPDRVIIQLVPGLRELNQKQRTEKSR